MRRPVYSAWGWHRAEAVMPEGVFGLWDVNREAEN
jgi:hypothetical protein